MSKEWYNKDSWYSPLKKEAPAEKKHSGWTSWRVAGILCLVVLLIAGTSIAFSDGGKKSPAPNVEFGFSDGADSLPDEMPDDWHDFFNTYYTDTQSDTADINIPAAKSESAFSIDLKGAGEKELSLQEIYQICANSTVAISGYVDDQVGYSWGTGVILSSDGLILTNTHVIEGCDSAKVTLFDNSEYDAKLIGADSISDVAVLKIDAEGLQSAEFGDSGALAVGDRVAAIGNPLGETFRMTLTDGIISAIERGINYNGHSMTLLQTNTALNEGNSGGALFNMYGQVVGITNMKMMSSYSSIEGIGFAIPSATVASVVPSLVDYGEMRGRPSLGITVGAVPENASERYEIPVGLYVSEVSPSSDAAQKGVKVGDIVTAVNAVPVSTTAEVLEIKNQLKIGDSMTLTLWREGETFDVSVLLMETNDVY